MIKTIFLIIFISWQTYNIRANILTVHLTPNPDSIVIFQGEPEKYSPDIVNRYKNAK